MFFSDFGMLIFGFNTFPAGVEAPGCGVRMPAVPLNIRGFDAAMSAPDSGDASCKEAAPQTNPAVES